MKCDGTRWRMGERSEGRNWRMEWLAIILHTTSEHGLSSITTADTHNSAASSRLNWRPPADLNGLVRFAERLNLFSARVPSHFKRSILISWRLRYLIAALVSLKARFVYRNLCICPPFIRQRKQSHIISYWSPCKVSVIFVRFLTKRGIWRKILAEIVDMKFYKNTCCGRRGKTERSDGASTR